MLKNLSEFVVRSADLVEAEGRALREQTVRVGLALSLILGAAVLALLSVLALLLGVLLLLQQTMPDWLGWVIIGAIGAGTAFAVLRIAMHLTDDQGPAGSPSDNAVARSVEIDDAYSQPGGPT